MYFIPFTTLFHIQVVKIFASMFMGGIALYLSYHILVKCHQSNADCIKDTGKY